MTGQWTKVGDSDLDLILENGRYRVLIDMYRYVDLDGTIFCCTPGEVNNLPHFPTKDAAEEASLLYLLKNGASVTP